MAASVGSITRSPGLQGFSTHGGYLTG